MKEAEAGGLLEQDLFSNQQTMMDLKVRFKKLLVHS
jgi:hypothetical protein